MCTSIILFQKNNNWPLVLATNRDEYFKRKSFSPKRHWKKQQYILGGLDKLAGGTWCAINDYGLVACIHNRKIEEKNFIPERSRGEIILEILKGKNMEDVIKIIKSIDFRSFNGFNLIFASKENAYWAKHSSKNKNLFIENIPEGISILTNSDLNDNNDIKINYYLKELNKIDISNPDKKNWSFLENILKNTTIKGQQNVYDSICFNINNVFGTVSSTIIGLNVNHKSSVYRYTDGPPNINVYKNINLI